MDTIAKILVNALEHESNQARFVLEAAKDTDLTYTPKDDLRPLIDLANHLAQIPLIDFKFYSKEFQTFEEVQAFEKELRRDDIAKMLEVYDKGIKTLKENISIMSDEQMMEKNLKAFYEEGEEKNWAYYLPEITSHLAMHKMQLWMYLKLAGAPVSMWTYYGVPKSE
jgi:hypothetical protein